MAGPACLIPVPEARLMHLDAGDLPGLIARARADAIGSAAELAALSAEGVRGPSLPALALSGDGWRGHLERPDRFDPGDPDGAIDRAFLGVRPLGSFGPDDHAGEAPAHFFWAAEVRALADELAVALRSEDEAFLCLHGPTTGREEPGVLASAAPEGDEGGSGPRRHDWTVAGHEFDGIDAATYDRLAGELRLVADFYALVAARGLALVVAPVPGEDGDG